MNKTSTIFVSTSRKHEKDTAYIDLRNQIERRLQEASAEPSSASTGAAAPINIATTIIDPTFVEPPTYYTTNGVELFDDTGIRWGEIINQIPVGDASYITAIQINAVLSGVDANTFELPSRAQYVTDVWFDNLKAEPVNHYTFIPEVTISTVAALGTNVIVTAFYLNKNEVL